AAQPQATASKRDAALHAPQWGVVPVIVTTRPGDAPAVADSMRQRGRAVRRAFSLISAVATDASADDLNALDADPSVISVSSDAAVSIGIGSGSTTVTDCASVQSTLGLPTQGVTGKGVGVAVIDSGLQVNGDFAGVSFYDFVSNIPGAAYDDYGH